MRELENVLERAATLSGSGTIEAEHIRLRAAPRVSGTPAAPAAIASRADASGGLSDQLEHLERDTIIKALEQSRYNKTAAAELLGVSYRALRYKIQKLGGGGRAGETVNRVAGRSHVVTAHDRIRAMKLPVIRIPRGLLLAFGLGLAFMLVSYAQIASDSNSALFDHAAFEAVFDRPILGTALSGHITWFVIWLTLLHLGLGAWCWLLARSTQVALPGGKQEIRQAGGPVVHRHGDLAAGLELGPLPTKLDRKILRGAHGHPRYWDCSCMTGSRSPTWPPPAGSC